MSIKSTLLLLFTFMGTVQPALVWKAQFAKCWDTFFSYGIYGSAGSFLSTYHGPSGVACGGDPLTFGQFKVIKSTSSGMPPFALKVTVRGANPWNLYSVYYLPIGGDPVSDKVFVGEFMTNRLGNASRYVKDCSATLTPACLLSSSTTPADLSGIVSTYPSASGQFLVYSRGISKKDNDGDGIYETWKTSDSTATGTLNNPTLWGTGSGYDGVQFLSAWH